MAEAFYLCIELSSTIRADSMAEISYGMGRQVVLDLAPVSFVVSDLFAGRANGQKAG